MVIVRTCVGLSHFHDCSVYSVFAYASMRALPLIGVQWLRRSSGTMFCRDLKSLYTTFQCTSTRKWLMAES